MKLLQTCILLFVLVLTSCIGQKVQPAAVTPTAGSATARPTGPLPTPPIGRTSTPDAQSAAIAFLDAWKAEDYPAMYALLTTISRDAISEDNFLERYRDEGEARGIPFLEWVERHYDPEALSREFKPGFGPNALMTRLLRRA